MREKGVVVRAVEGSCGSMAGWCVPGRAGVRLIFGAVLLACLLLLISSRSAQAACRTGLIDVPTTWSVADSPCIVDQSVWVLEGVTLTIQPGVVVKVNPGLALQIDGTLVARGTSTERITFTSNASGPSRPARGDWGYVLFTNTSPDAEFDESGAYLSGSILEHCVVEYAGKADQPAVRLQSTSPFIHRCTVRENLRGGIDASGLDRPIRVEFTTISNNGGTGIAASATSTNVLITVSNNPLIANNSSTGISISGGTSTIFNNTITGNTTTGSSGGGYICGGGVYISGGTSTITNNTVTRNTSNNSSYVSCGGGIYISGGTSIITENTITGNTTGSGGMISRGGVYIGGGTSTITENTITGNISSSSYDSYGGGIYISGGTSIITENIITGNTSSGGRTIWGGGVYIGDGTSTISGNTITGNTGGGVFINGTSTISGNTITHNTSSSYGGGVYISGTSRLSSNLIRENSSGSSGAAIYYAGSGGTISYNTITDNTATGDRGGLQHALHQWKPRRKPQRHLQ